MSGNDANSGRQENMPAVKTSLDPHLLCMRAKKSTWKRPFRTPKTDRSDPMVGGGRPSPPSSIGVDKKTGWMARKAISMSEIQAQFAAMTTTRGVRREKSEMDLGFSWLAVPDSGLAGNGLFGVALFHESNACESD